MVKLQTQTWPTVVSLSAATLRTTQEKILICVLAFFYVLTIGLLIKSWQRPERTSQWYLNISILLGLLLFLTCMSLLSVVVISVGFLY